MARALGAEIRTRFEFPSFPASGRVNTGKKYIVISNTCSELSRERLYPQGLLATLCIELYSLCHCPILLSGTKTDFEQYENTLKDKRLAGLPVQNIAGKYSVEEFLSVLYHECRLLVTVDSAPLHFAYRLGVPTVSLWGPTNPATRMRETALFRPVYLSAPCSPCAHYTTVLPCGGDNFCMKNMSVAMVLQKVEEVMNNIV
jgi:ADP-heptose:LPS heptosyltransferase